MSSGASAALAEPYVAQNAFAGSDDIYVCDMGAFTDIATFNLDEFGGTKTSATVTALDFLPSSEIDNWDGTSPTWSSMRTRIGH